MKPSLILASASQSRRQLLKNAVIEFSSIVSSVDEDIIKKVFLKDGQVEDLALVLAQAKAIDVSQTNQNAFVIGADQTLIFENTIYDKPISRKDARDQLLKLRSNTHQLETAVSVAKNGQVVWNYSESSYLTMRNFSPEFLGHYLSTQGDEVKTSVGGYKLEGQGLQFFERIEGDFFSILGLPMLELLKFLRRENIIEQ